MTKARRVCLAVAALLGSTGAVHAGGWTIITLADVPEFVRADGPLTLTFSVQHGVMPLDGLKPVVRGSTSGRIEVVGRPAQSRFQSEPATSGPAPPFPNATRNDEILANVAFGIQRMRIDQLKDGEALREAVKARRILDVLSEGVTSDYYVVELIHGDGRPLADVLVGRDGHVWSVWLFRPDVPRHLAPDLEHVSKRLSQRYGPTQARYYHAVNNLEVAGGSQYVPLIVAATPRGRFFVNSHGEIFIEESFEKYERSPSEETRDIWNKRPGQRWLLKKDGIATMKKIGELR